MYNTNTRTYDERKKTFTNRNPIVCIPKITRVQQRTAFSVVLFIIKMTSHIDLLCSSTEGNSCRGRIEIKYLLLWLLQNNLLGVEMFEIQKPWLINNISQPWRLFYNKQDVVCYIS